ncbi:MAG: hypothetical protein FWH03_01800 [Firmicutes bacterium]|nr:hypothetical protein [Bacillota bacterium]
MKNKDIKKNYDGLTMGDIVDIDLSQNTSVVVKEQDLDKFFETLMKRVTKLFQRQQKYMTDNNDTTDALLFFLEKYPELFADEYGTINRDMIKWALAENIKRNRALIDKIQEIEKKLNLEIHHEW